MKALCFPYNRIFLLGEGFYLLVDIVSFIILFQERHCFQSI